MQTCGHELEFMSLGLDCESERDYESESDPDSERDFESQKDPESDTDSDENSKPSQ